MRSKGSLLSLFTSSDTSSRGDYNRLNPSGSSRSKIFVWKRFAIAAGILIILVLLLGPRHNREKVYDLGSTFSEFFPVKPLVTGSQVSC